jgi:predicted transcriptional regulator
MRPLDGGLGPASRARLAIFAVASRQPPEPVAMDTLTRLQRTTFEAVLAQPGLTIQEMGKILGVTHSTAGYHLLCLVRFGLVEQLRDGRELRHFPLPRSSLNRAYVEALLRNEKSAKLLHFLCEAEIERMTLNQIAGRVGLAFGYVRRLLLKLDDMGLVDLVRRKYRYHITVAPELRILASRLP